MSPAGRIVNVSSVSGALHQFNQLLQTRLRNPKITLEEVEALAQEYEVSFLELVALKGTISIFQDMYKTPGFLFPSLPQFFFLFLFFLGRAFPMLHCLTNISYLDGLNARHGDQERLGKEDL